MEINGNSAGIGKFYVLKQTLMSYFCFPLDASLLSPPSWISFYMIIIKNKYNKYQIPGENTTTKNTDIIEKIFKVK